MIRDLRAFIGIPSVSGQRRHRADVARAAAWLATRLRRAGLSRVEVLRTPGHPVVIGSWRGAPGRPTVLVYGHYDVQPADPIRLWRSPPFAAEVRGDRLYGRGASDDKGQLLCHVVAIERMLRRRGRLPVNVVCLFEGEEEIGSPNLACVLVQRRVDLVADVAVASDTRMLGPDRPALTYALRGSVAMDLQVRGPSRDLHSGLHGGAVHNPLQALCELIASMHDDRGVVRIPGFYDQVRTLGPEERAELRRTGPTDADVLRSAASARAWGSCGETLYERTTAWPALTVHGLSGGYQGSGNKSVIPSVAGAKLGLRLVSEQDPEAVARLVTKHVRQHTPNTVTSRITVTSASPPVTLDRRSAALRAAAAAYLHGFGALPVMARSGGSIPAVSLLQRLLGLDTVLLGFGLPDDRIHAPNESCHLPTFRKGVVTAGRFLDQVASAVVDTSDGRVLGGVR